MHKLLQVGHLGWSMGLVTKGVACRWLHKLLQVGHLRVVDEVGN